jgi:deoxyribonuclease V
VAAQDEIVLEAQKQVLADGLHSEEPPAVEPLGDPGGSRARVWCLDRNSLADQHPERVRGPVDGVAFGHVGEDSAVAAWPDSAEELRAAQLELAAARPPPWHPSAEPVAAGCFVCFPRGKSGSGAAGDPGWAAAALLAGGRPETAVVAGAAGSAYEPGLLALREGPLLEAAVRALPQRPGVLIVNATGRDHPRGAGLAVHLGAVLDLPTVGVTHRPLAAAGQWPADERGARSPLVLDGELVGYWLRTRAGIRPLAVHSGWRTNAATSAEIVLSQSLRRTPEPLRLARRAARTARARAG